jgi:hypothetical protein
MKTKCLFILIIFFVTSLFLTNACKEDDCTKLTWFQDYDGDSFGNPDVSLQSCDQPNGYVSDDTDFNDTSVASYPGASETCNDGLDNDGDSFIDCDDFDCDCDESKNCHDGLDNDGDGFIDCEDFDCDCDESKNCHDGLDNDGDGYVDCDDFDCNSDSGCI